MKRWLVAVLVIATQTVGETDQVRYLCLCAAGPCLDFGPELCGCCDTPPALPTANCLSAGGVAENDFFAPGRIANQVSTLESARRGALDHTTGFCACLHIQLPRAEIMSMECRLRSDPSKFLPHAAISAGELLSYQDSLFVSVGAIRFCRGCVNRADELQLISTVVLRC